MPLSFNNQQCKLESIQQKQYNLQHLKLQPTTVLTPTTTYKNQYSQHPQKWNLQGVDEHNDRLLTPCPESLPTMVHSQKYTLGGRLVGKPPLHEADEVPKETRPRSAPAREWP